MDFFHQTPILPSNAPPWPRLDGFPCTQGPEEQHYNNRFTESHGEPTQDYLDKASDDSTSLTPCGQAGAGLAYFQPTRVLSQSFDWASPNTASARSHHRHGHDDGMFLTHKEDIEAEDKAMLLASKIARCESYIKYRNRQPKEKKSKDDQKWPDHIEDAFLRALCRWEPCGRGKKVPPGGAKLMGRNELIADYILTHTGESRTRKQVSSHIQVLKPFVMGEATIMRYLATEPTRQSAATKQARRSKSTYDPRSRARKGTSNHCTDSTLQVLSNLQPEEFHMYMRRVDTKEDIPGGQVSADVSKVLHTYSSTRDRYPGDRQIHSETEMYGLFPELTNVPVDRYRDGKFLALQVPIALHSRRHLANAELAISFVLKARALDPPNTISSRTCLYNNGVPFTFDPKGAYGATSARYDGGTMPWEECKVEKVEVEEDKGLSGPRTQADAEMDRTKMVRYYVPFSSRFWADHLWRTALSYHAVTDIGPHVDSTEASRAAFQAKRDEVTAAFSQLTAVQEIVGCRLGHDPEVVLTVHFTFSHTTSDFPTTEWQFLDFTPVFSDLADRPSADSQESACSGTVDTGCGSENDSLANSFSIANGDTSETALAPPVSPTHDIAVTRETSWIHNAGLPGSFTTLDLAFAHNDGTYSQTFDHGGNNVFEPLSGGESLHTTAPAMYNADMGLQADPSMLPPHGARGFEYAGFYGQSNNTSTQTGYVGHDLAAVAIDRGPTNVPFQVQAFAGADSGRANADHTGTHGGESFPLMLDGPGAGGIQSDYEQKRTFGFRHTQDRDVDVACLRPRPHEIFDFEASQLYSQVPEVFPLPAQKQTNCAQRQDVFPLDHVQTRNVLDGASPNLNQETFEVLPGHSQHERFGCEQPRSMHHDDEVQTYL